jgi:hypothetical protein
MIKSMMQLQHGEPAIRARLDQAAIADHIGGEDGDKEVPGVFLGHAPFVS